MTKLKIYRIDFGTRKGKYVATQFVEAPNRKFVIELVKSGMIFNRRSRKLLKIKEIKNIKSAQKTMDRPITIRKFN